MWGCIWRGRRDIEPQVVGTAWAERESKVGQVHMHRASWEGLGAATEGGL